MLQRALAAFPAAVIVIAPPAAHAEMIVAAPVVVPQDNVSVTFEFLGSNAGFSGELSFLGAGSEVVVSFPAADTGIAGLGHQLFENQLGVPGDSMTLGGTYDAGDVLHFAYRVFDPIDEQDLLRTDLAATTSQFAWDAQDSVLFVEDLRPGHSWYDADYNDIIVHVIFTSAPGPGMAAIACLTAPMLLSRRRVRR